MKRVSLFAFYVCVAYLILAGVYALSMQRIGDFEVYTEEDGLQSGLVEHIAIAPDGRKWFSGIGGLTVFDEVSWRQYPFGCVEGLAIDASGAVWIAVSYDQIFCLQTGADDFQPFPIPDVLRYGEIYSELAFDAQDRLWIGESGAGGLISYYPDDTPWPPWLTLPSGWRIHPISREGIYPRLIWSIACSGRFAWCATNDALFWARDEGQGCEWDDMHLSHWSNVLRAPRVVTASGDGRVWASPWPSDETRVRMYSDDGETSSWVEVPNTPDGRRPYPTCVSAIHEPGINGLWVGVETAWGEGMGAYWLDLTSDEWTWVSSWGPGRFYDIAVDPRTGDIWFAGGPGVGVLRGWYGLFLSIETDRPRYTADDMLTLLLDMLRPPKVPVDFYVALEMPSGELLFYPSFGAEMTPFLSSIEIPANTHLESYELFSLTLPELPAGTYRWYAALTHAGTTDFASNIASCDWQFE